MSTNEEHWPERFRIASEDWVDKESAASLLEETKSAVLSQRMIAYGDIPVSHAERQVKASEEWLDYVTKMVKAREAANRARVNIEYIKMRYWEESGQNATRRAEMRLG
jgi:hypothetical protein